MGTSERCNQTRFRTSAVTASLPADPFPDHNGLPTCFYPEVLVV